MPKQIEKSTNTFEALEVQSTLENIISSLEYQLRRYSTITHDYEKVRDKLMPNLDESAINAKSALPDITGHLNTLGNLIDRFASLNAENEELITIFNTHI